MSTSKETTKKSFHIQLFGQLRVLNDLDIDVTPSSRRSKAILLFLALSSGTSATREKLSGLFWQDRGDVQARASLRQCVHEIRRIRSSSDHALVWATRSSVGLNSNLFSSDFANIAASLETNNTNETIHFVKSIGQSMIGDGLEMGGGFDDWLTQTRSKIERQLGRELLASIETLISDSNLRRALTLADAWLFRNPTDEVVAATAINTEIKTGSRASAQRRYQELEEMLSVHLGVSPGLVVKDALSPKSADASLQAPVLGQETKNRPRLAVLAFDNLSPERDFDFFSEGMSEEILQHIARSLDLSVIARSSSFRFKHGGKIVSDIARQLNVTHILDGSVRRESNNVRITASLVECEGQSTIWTGRFDRSLNSVLAIHEEIASAVSRELEVVFSDARSTVTIDPLAHDHYLQARSLAGSPINAMKCIALLEKATERQPDFAEAWASLSMARAIVARWLSDHDSFLQHKADAEIAASTAIELDYAAGLPHVSLSLLEDPAQFEKREQLLSMALQSSPKDPEILKHMSDFASSVGRMNDSRDLLDRAVDLDPMNPMIANNAANALFDVGDIEGGFQKFEELRERWPASDWLLTAPLISAALHRDKTRVNSFTVKRKRPNETYLLALELTEIIAASEADQKSVLMTRAAKQIAEHGSVDLITLLLLCELGFSEKAFALADRSTFNFSAGRSPGGAFLTGIIFGPFNQSMRKDPRFITICAKLGLCKYWTQSEKWPDCVSENSHIYDFKKLSAECVKN